MPISLLNAISNTRGCSRLHWWLIQKLAPSKRIVTQAGDHRVYVWFGKWYYCGMIHEN